MTLKERVMNNLTGYKYIGKYLGNAVRKRLEIRGYTRGMLTSRLLDPDTGGKEDLDRLETVLMLGEKNCTNFKHIFKERKLPNKDLAIDGEIINTLAEVKAFEVLYNKDFENIKKIKPSGSKTVDFTATKKEQNYAMEVTRIGIPESPKKESKPYLTRSLKDNTGSLLAALTVYTSDTKKTITNRDNKQKTEMSNYDIWFYSIESAVKTKYVQLEQYILNNDDRKIKGMIFISIGLDYFVLSKYARSDMFLRKIIQGICQELFLKLKSKEGSYPYLNHLIFNPGIPAKKPYVFPDFNSKEQNT